MKVYNSVVPAFVAVLSLPLLAGPAGSPMGPDAQGKGKTSVRAAEVAAPPGPPLSLAHAMERALRLSPDLRTAAADLERARGEKVMAQQPLPANPELELNALRGSRRITPSPSFSTQSFLSGNSAVDLGPSAFTGQPRQDISGFELGLAQQFDISGKRKAVREVAQSSVALAVVGLERARLAVQSTVRLNFVTSAAMHRLRLDLQQRLAHLQAVRARKGTFIDPRLGPYATRAFANDVGDLQASYRDVELLETTATTKLRGLLLLPSGKELNLASTDDLTFQALSDGAIPPEGALGSNPEARNALAALEKAQASARLAGLQSYPDPTLFVLFGRQNVAAGGPFGPDREAEKTVRFGVRLQLPVVNGTAGERQVAHAEVMRAQAELERVRSVLRSSLVGAASRYRQALTALEAARSSVGSTSSYLNQIDYAFMAGRISYFEFWTEYDRSNRAMRRYADTLVETASALGELELIVGHRLEGSK